ncbi:SDR family oxidoreductase [Aquibacillus koreensis]|uniref:SDR family oxidoreductase n=1 Tax=Aquibacillus koreensis TaxID=279446 RepID=A0A9X3WRX5_9BACI|nr:SDR family oxidoreductase [Aquibacillus koreensis]MCT2537888.1 SDR family oxidoreductase [Aquibacillus koreensis]MDC3422656.1 SDR family oxidoreductase [Aquibacillus koreensis]
MNILITGANRGLGLAMAAYGVENGHHVYAGVRDPEGNASEALRDLQAKHAESLEILKLDVTSEDSVVEASSQLKNKQLDVIVNNAGLLNEREHTVEELDLEACMLAFDVNTLGPIRVVKHFLPLLEQGEKQSIINVSSEAASLTNSYSGDYPYGMSKVALNMLTEKLHVYLKEKDIQVLSVHPGWMKTDMGGEKAPTNPADTAEGIFALMERKVTVDSKYQFVDYLGNPMDI